MFMWNGDGAWKRKCSLFLIVKWKPNYFNIICQLGYSHFCHRGRDKLAWKYAGVLVGGIMSETSYWCSAVQWSPHGCAAGPSMIKLMERESSTAGGAEQLIGAPLLPQLLWPPLCSSSSCQVLLSHVLPVPAAQEHVCPLAPAPSLWVSSVC